MAVFHFFGFFKFRVELVMFVLLQKTLDGAFPRMPLFKVSRFSREWKFGGKDSVLPRDHVQIPNCPKFKACRRLAIGNSHENFNCTDIAKVASSKDLSPRRRSGSKRGTCLAVAGCTAACCMTGCISGCMTCSLQWLNSKQESRPCLILNVGH